MFSPSGSRQTSVWEIAGPLKATDATAQTPANSPAPWKTHTQIKKTECSEPSPFTAVPHTESLPAEHCQHTRNTGAPTLYGSTAPCHEGNPVKSDPLVRTYHQRRTFINSYFISTLWGQCTLSFLVNIKASSSYHTFHICELTHK